MNESQQIAIHIVLTLAIGAMGALIIPLIQGGGDPGNVSSDNYSAIIYPDGTLREDFTYTFTNYNYQMMFRDWNAAVVTTPSSSARVCLIWLE